MVVWGIGTGLAGHWGVPRRHWDITFDRVSTLPTQIFQTTEVDVFMALLGIGAVIAVIGGAMFVTIIVATVALGQRTATPDLGRVMANAFSSAPAVAGASGEEGEAPAPAHGAFEAPGALVLSLAFLTLFVLLYGFSWFELSTVPWQVR